MCMVCVARDNALAFKKSNAGEREDGEWNAISPSNPWDAKQEGNLHARRCFLSLAPFPCAHMRASQSFLSLHNYDDLCLSGFILYRCTELHFLSCFRQTSNICPERMVLLRIKLKKNFLFNLIKKDTTDLKIISLNYQNIIR